MYETYRMLGREHALDLEREARQRHLAARLVAKPALAEARVVPERKKWAGFVPRRLAALLR